MAVSARAKAKAKQKRPKPKTGTRTRGVEDFTFDKKAFYSPAEIARVLDVSDQTVLDWIHSEKLFAAQIGPRLYRVPLASFMQFLGVPPQIRWTRRPNAAVDTSEDEELDRAES